MKIATLGYDHDLHELIRYVMDSTEHTVTACFDPGSGRKALAAIAPMAVGTDESWEVLLTGSVADVVCVATRPEETQQAEARDEQLRKLVQGPSPLIIIPPSCQMIVGFELEMIRQDSECLMIPYHPVLYHPHYRRLRDILDSSESSPLGKIEQLVWERQAGNRDRADVLHAFSRDACVLRDLLVNVSRVAAMGGSTNDDALANLGVHLTGDSDRLARWSIGPVSQAAGAKVTVIGSHQTACLSMPDKSFDFELVLNGEKQQTQGETPPQRLLEVVQEQIENSPTGSNNWEPVCRALELEEAVERSARRGRTIELHNEMVTERETFKGMMAAGGCGLLLWVMTMLLVAGVVEGLQLPIRDSFLWKLWPLVLFAPLGIFLFLQLLQLAIANRDLAPPDQASGPTREKTAE
ncbi:MAG: hypothetical protein GY768_19965 [Planctomycetaceae bacterium]|nr:hypothetical protein [Planctomycetaceae bacterium]